MSEVANIETDPFLDALKDLLISSEDIPELVEGNVAVWHHGVTDPDEDIANSITKFGGISVLVYDLGGNVADEDIIGAAAAIEFFVDTTKRNRRANTALRLGGEIRDAIMRLVHRNITLRNLSPNFDCRVTGYSPLADAEFAAWRITVSHSIYL